MNKLIILALCMSACLAAYVPSGYTEIPKSSGDANQTIQYTLTNGSSLIVAALYKNGYISGTNFVVSQVNSYAQQVKSSSTLFAFDAVMTNNNDTTITSTFIVQRTKTPTYSLYSYSVTISKTTPVAPAYVDVSPSEVASSPVIQSLRAFGFNQVVAQVQQKYPYVAGPFVVNVTNSVQRQTISDGRVIYKFNAEGYNDDGVRLVAAYAVSYRASNGEQLLLASTYVLVDGDSVDDLGELGSGSGYSTVTQATVDGSALIKSIRDFGINAMVEDGVEKGKLPDNTFTIQTTNSVAQKTSGNVTKYKFSLVLVDNKGTTVSGIFIVSYNSSTKAMELVGFVYSCQNSS